MRHAQEKAHKDHSPPAPHPAKMHHMTQPTVAPYEVTALSGHPRSQILHMSKIPYPPQRISVFSLADIGVPGHHWSLRVTIRHPAFLLVEADGIEPTTSCLQSTRSPN